MRCSHALISSTCLRVRPISSRPSISRMRSAGEMSKATSGPPGPLMRWVVRSTVNGAAPFTATTRPAKLSASPGASGDGEQSVLQAVLAVDVGEALGDDDADAVCQHAPHGRLARRAGAEIVAGD